MKRMNRVARLLALLVVVACAAVARVRAQDGGKFEKGAPRSFFLPKTENDAASWWTQASPTEYREHYEASAGLPDNTLTVVGRRTMNGVMGTLVYRPEVTVFVPDADTGSEWVGLYWKGEWNEKWRPITDVE
jgi:hypothetical protein